MTPAEQDAITRAVLAGLDERSSLTWEYVALWFAGLALASLLSLCATLLAKVLRSLESNRRLGEWLKAEHEDPESVFANAPVLAAMTELITIGGETNRLLRSDQRHRVYQGNLLSFLTDKAGASEIDRVKFKKPLDGNGGSI